VGEAGSKLANFFLCSFLDSAEGCDIFPETLSDLQRNALRHIQADTTLHKHRRENLGTSKRIRGEDVK
jgi:hypothetical protein